MVGETHRTETDGEASAASIGVGMLGSAFVARAHASAYHTIAHMAEPPLKPRLVALAGRSAERTVEAAKHYGFASSTSDWRELLSDDGVGLVDVCGPNSLHAEASIAAAANGKHILCEKPLGRDARESYEAWQAVQRAGVRHMCAFNYRFVPAVRLARQLIEAGEIGQIRHFRGRYLQSWLVDPAAPVSWRLSRSTAGSGALSDLGAHVVDTARYLVGEVSATTGVTRTFVPERPGGLVDVDDAFEAVVEFEGGAVGTIEASRVSVGRKNSFRWEIDGTHGSLAFDLERLNELRVALRDDEPLGGFRTVIVSEATHPFWDLWWPPGHVLAWEHTFVHEILHFLEAIAGDVGVRPHGASFEDGYRVAEVCDAILRSAASGGREQVTYRA
jgi:predicted dehydrogenase